jgi:hypothetical protein
MQVYRELEFLYSRRWASGALALKEADEEKVRCGISARAAFSSRGRHGGLKHDSS